MRTSKETGVRGDKDGVYTSYTTDLCYIAPKLNQLPGCGDQDSRPWRFLKQKRASTRVLYGGGKTSQPLEWFFGKSRGMDMGASIG